MPLSGLAASIFRTVPVERWPRLAGRLVGIQVPRGERPHPQKSPRGSANINVIFELMRRAEGVAGDVVQCGVYRGATLLPMGLYAEQKGWAKTVFGLDSFEGFDDAVKIDVALGGAADAQKKVGGFSGTSEPALRAKLRALRLENRVRLVKGFFRDTLASLGAGPFSFVHLDCDIYQSYKECLEYLYPRVPRGGVILFDEYNDPPWPGCNKAIDEFLADKPEKPLELERDNYQKWYVVKA